MFYFPEKESLQPLLLQTLHIDIQKKIILSVNKSTEI
jgi:hypothetical protein